MNIRAWLIVVLLGCFTSFCYWPHETVWPNQNSVFRSTGQLCMLDVLVVYIVMIVGRAPNCLTHWKSFSLTHYETLMTRIGYCHWTVSVERNYLPGCRISWSFSWLYRHAISWDIDIVCLIAMANHLFLILVLPGQVYLWRSNVLIQ